MFKEEQEVNIVDQEEANYFNQQIMSLQDSLFDNPDWKPIVDVVFGNAIPLFRYPDVEACLGLDPSGSYMSIHEGYAVMSYDYSVVQSEEDCLFDMKKWKEENKGFSQFSMRNIQKKIEEVQRDTGQAAIKVLSGNGMHNMAAAADDLGKKFEEHLKNDPTV